LLPFIIIGLTTGAVYGLAGVGLVLTYKTSGIFNFAHGAMATIAAYCFYSLTVLHGWSWAPAALVAVLVAGPVMGVVMELIARRLQGTSLAMRVAATVGLTILIASVVTLIYPATGSRNVAVFLAPGHEFELGGTIVQWSQAITLAFAIVVTAALSVFFRVSRRGAAMRAVVDNPELLDLVGTSPTGTRRIAWVLGGVLVAASGVLFAPLLPLDPNQLTLLIVAAFGAAAIGSFSSLPLTLAGGIGIGVLASLCTKWFTSGLLAGLPPSLPFVVLFVVLLVFPKRYLVDRAFVVPRSRSTWHAPAPLQLGGGVAIIVFLAIVPSFAGVHLTDWTNALAMVIVFLSLGLLVRTSGQVSLSHVAFTAIGACAFSHLAVDQNVPWFVALVLAGLIAMPIGAILAIPAIRLSGLYLALATFGFGILLQGMFYTQSYMFRDNNLGLPEPRPGFAQSDKGYYHLVLVLAVAATIFVVALNRSRLGRLLRGMADSPTALETSGTAVNVTRVIVFCVSAFMAAVGGALVGVSQGTVSADSYQPLLSLTYFALIIIVVGSEPWYAVIAAGALLLPPSYIDGANVNTWLQVIFGATAVLIAILPGKATSVPAVVQRTIDGLFGRWSLPGRGRATTEGAAPPAVDSGVLELDDLKVTFGGHVAVDAVSLRAPTGRITGLIGPNGAGKTTTFNACSGLLRPASGTVRLDASDMTRRGPATRARAGLGRTFQTMELLDSLTVRENVAAGAEGVLAGANPVAHLIGRPGDATAVRRATEHALALCDLTELADVPVATLSTGQRRLVELARCLAGPYRILLLDEPSSGLDRAETERFGEILKKVVRERGVGILLVEHDMSLVLDVCEHVYVLDFGELIFEGPASEITDSQVVRAAYLGDPAVEEVVS
jgi:ABC-type branched-subunit amino acid transport system ATPase component/branched-subunit amino acid ABC-type transport system permease component